jgi:hypothetical protein
MKSHACGDPIKEAGFLPKMLLFMPVLGIELLTVAVFSHSIISQTILFMVVNSAKQS